MGSYERYPPVSLNGTRIKVLRPTVGCAYGSYKLRKLAALGCRSRKKKKPTSADNFGRMKIFSDLEKRGLI